MDLLKVENLSFTYKGEVEPSIKNISFSLKKGSCIKIEGHNGSGKSTLCYSISGIVPNHIKGELEGNILLNNNNNIRTIPFNRLSDEVAIVLKDPEPQLIMPSVEDEWAFPLENRNISREEMIFKVRELASFLKIKHLLNRSTNKLSLGEKQLVAFGAAIIAEPSIIILDEALSMLDKCSTRRLLDIIKNLKYTGNTIIIVDHINDFSNIVDEVIVLENGRIAINRSDQLPDN
jgi:energy-coupling factor transporter ATP-binding protein EcfA2